METISLPTKTTRRSRSGSSARQRVGGRRRVAREDADPSVPGARRAHALGERAEARAAPRRARAGRTASMSTPGRAEPGARARASGRPSPPTGSRRCGASRPARRGPPPAPRARTAGSARVRLDGVLERRAVDLDRVGHVEPRRAPRASTTGPITRWLASATSGRGALGDLAHRGDVALEVGVELGVGELGERARLDAVVAVGDVDGQQAAEVGAVDRRARGLASASSSAARRRPSRPRRRPTPARTGRAPGRAGAPRGPRARAPRRGARCRRSSRCRRSR